MQQQNYQSAIDDFNIVISNDQSNFMAIKHKGFCLSMLKMYNQAIKCYDQIIKYILDIKEKQVLFFEKGFCHLKLQQNLSAKQVFDEAIELDINNQELKLKIANLARDNKIVDYAYRLYDELICENEKIPIYYIEKASMCEKYQDYIKAKELYDKVINLCDKNFEFYLKRSKILIQLQLFNEAIEDLYQGIKLDDQQSELYYEFGQILLYKQNFNEARTMFQKACVLKENVEKYHIKYAITLKMLKAESEAIQHLVGVLKNYPDFEDCRDVLDSLSSQYQYTQEYIKVFSYISISFMQEGVLDQNQNKEEIQNYIQETLETELKTKIPKINNIFEIICQLMKNLYQIDNQKEFQMIICKIFKNNFNNVEQFIKQIIQISKRMASLQTYNFKQEKGITVGQIQKEIDKLGQSYQILNQFKNKVASTAISDCLGLLTTLIINSNEIEHNLNNKIEIMIESDRLNQYS